MGRFLATGAAFALVLLRGALLAGEPAAQGVPQLVVPAEIDFGEVVRGDTATAVFELRNVGTGVLRVLQAKPG